MIQVSGTTAAELGAVSVRMFVVLAGLVCLSGCGPAPEQVQLPTLMALAAEQPAGEVDNTVPFADAAALARGKKLWARCATCHQIGLGARNMAGPQLNNLIGRRVAGVPDFPYSEALSEVEMVWTASALDVWLTAPYRTVPGTTMSFGGISDSYDRTALIAYIDSTSNGSDDTL
ncbi:MAG: c-type cytochrome [Pseudomonadota bacterium]